MGLVAPQSPQSLPSLRPLSRRGLRSWTPPWVGSVLWRPAACGSPELCSVGVNSSVSSPESDREARRCESQLRSGESGDFILG